MILLYNKKWGNNDNHNTNCDGIYDDDGKENRNGDKNNNNNESDNKNTEEEKQQTNKEVTLTFPSV